MSDDADEARVIAHDLNNLVTIISMGCELLRRRFGEGDPSRALVDDVAGAATRAGELTRRLLELTARAARASSEAEASSERAPPDGVGSDSSRA